MLANPFVPFAEVTRNGTPESVHAGVAVAVHADAGVIAAWGSPDYVTFPRSSLKPFQALDLIESGAADALSLTEAHLAIACASHRGEVFHEAQVRDWLGVLGVDEGALACGPDYPRHEPTAHARIREGLPKSRVWHNCSGKHCGFLSTAKHLDYPLHGYSEAEHPCQQRYLDALSDFLDEDARTLIWGTDSCTLPAPAVSMARMARAAARFATPQGQGRVRSGAIERLHAAMRAHPRLVSGTGMLNEVLVEVTKGEILAKSGAEGYLMALIPARGLGLTLKVADGNARARNGVLIAVLLQLGIIDASQAQALTAKLVPAVMDSIGREVGTLRVLLPKP